MTLRLSTPALEGVFQGSKYLKYHVLASKEELAQLFDSSFSIYLLTGLTDGQPIDPAFFLAEYGSWIEELKQGRAPTDGALRRLLACAFAEEADALWKQAAPGNRYLIKIGKPIVQVQAHFFTYSPIDAVFRPMTCSQAGIFWGLQFSFPQIAQDPKTLEFFEVEPSPLWQRIKQWVKDATRPTPFVVDGKKTNVPIRLGKNCFSWINNHPQLGSLYVSA